MILIVSDEYNHYAVIIILSLTIKDAVFGLEFPMYFIKEKDESTVVSILLLEKDLGSPVTLQLSTSDLTASKYRLTFLCTVLI